MRKAQLLTPYLIVPQCVLIRKQGRRNWNQGRLSVLTQVDSLFVCKLMPMTCIVPDLIVVVPQVMAKFAYAYSVCRTPVSFVTSLM